MTGPATGDISVRSINQEIIGMDGTNHLVNHIIPSIAVINPSSFRLHAFTSAVGRDVTSYVSTRVAPASLPAVAGASCPRPPVM